MTVAVGASSGIVFVNGFDKSTVYVVGTTLVVENVAVTLLLEAIPNPLTV